MTTGGTVSGEVTVEPSSARIVKPWASLLKTPAGVTAVMVTVQSPGTDSGTPTSSASTATPAPVSGTILKILKGDELGDLAEVFNAMRDKLQRTTLSRNYVDRVLASMNEAILFVDADFFNRRRIERLGDEHSWILRPSNNIDFLAAQLANDSLHPGALDSDAGSDRVHRFLSRRHGDLCAIARLTDVSGGGLTLPWASNATRPPMTSPGCASGPASTT